MTIRDLLDAIVCGALMLAVRAKHGRYSIQPGIGCRGWVVYVYEPRVRYHWNRSMAGALVWALRLRKEPTC